ncbi:DUF2809 domain-containing protein [Bryobacter aggregatus]|uniref:DUF2809 domain-containing protein n=1 Tax=Bryobacter aggregatus TaxID=360054 RepID=UPI000691E032|nr:DUF2809 domain-containing protein [Bryobacter aggregatus]
MGWILGVVALGLFSRVMPIGWVLWDKYLGDALYAAMVFLLLGACFRLGVWPNALCSMSLMTAIECFQLTGLPAAWVQSPALGWQLIGRAVGTSFSMFDLTAYAVGVLLIAAISDRA